MAFIPIEWLVFLDMILIYIGWSLLPLVFLYLALKTIGKARKNSFKIALGTLINLIGLALLSSTDNPSSGFRINDFLMQMPNFDLIISILMMVYPLLSILGVTLIFLGIKFSLNVPI